MMELQQEIDKANGYYYSEVNTASLYPYMLCIVYICSVRACMRACVCV